MFDGRNVSDRGAPRGVFPRFRRTCGVLPLSRTRGRAAVHLPCAPFYGDKRRSDFGEMIHESAVFRHGNRFLGGGSDGFCLFFHRFRTFCVGEKFCRIAPSALKPEFCLQTWYTDPNYGLPFGKVMLRNTIYLESKKTTRLKQNGIYVDIFPFDFAPESAKQQDKLAKALLQIYRVKLMKSGYKPWMENDSIVWKKRIGYLFYQAKALFARQEDLSRAYDALAESIDYSSVLCGQCALPRLDCFQTEWFEHMTDYVFESEHFPGPVNYDAVLSAEYGDYMTLPPVEERENRHQIYRVEFDA